MRSQNTFPGDANSCEGEDYAPEPESRSPEPKPVTDDKTRKQKEDFVGPVIWRPAGRALRFVASQRARDGACLGVVAGVLKRAGKGSVGRRTEPLAVLAFLEPVDEFLRRGVSEGQASAAAPQTGEGEAAKVPSDIAVRGMRLTPAIKRAL
jgi:hypothetical protein